MPRTTTKKASGTDAIKAFLLWARENKFAVSSVAVDGVEVSLAADLGLAPSNISLANPRAESDLLSEFGGNAFARLRRETMPVSPLEPLDE